MVTVEAMKMEHVVTAPSDGTVANVLVAERQVVALGEPLAELTPPENP
jgi:acetyl-CoA/propionyl-CoA carboxylase biotin carboxyl carrier protein